MIVHYWRKQKSLLSNATFLSCNLFFHFNLPFYYPHKASNVLCHNFMFCPPSFCKGAGFKNQYSIMVNDYKTAKLFYANWHRMQQIVDTTRLKSRWYINFSHILYPDIYFICCFTSVSSAGHAISLLLC